MSIVPFLIFALVTAPFLILLAVTAPFLILLAVTAPLRIFLEVTALLRIFFVVTALLRSALEVTELEARRFSVAVVAATAEVMDVATARARMEMTREAGLMARVSLVMAPDRSLELDAIGQNRPFFTRPDRISPPDLAEQRTTSAREPRRGRSPRTRSPHRGDDAGAPARLEQQLGLVAQHEHPDLEQPARRRQPERYADPTAQRGHEHAVVARGWRRDVDRAAEVLVLTHEPHGAHDVVDVNPRELLPPVRAVPRHPSVPARVLPDAPVPPVVEPPPVQLRPTEAEPGRREELPLRGPVTEHDRHAQCDPPRPG